MAKKKSDSTRGAAVEAGPTTEDEALVGRILEVLLHAGKPMTDIELHAELNAGRTDYVAEGPIEKALRVLTERGLARMERGGWTAVPPGEVGMRRGKLLATIAVKAVQPNAGSCPVRPGEESADARGLAAAGLVAVSEADGEVRVSMTPDAARNVLERGAVLAVADTMPECRGITSGPLVVALAPEAAQAEAAKERAEREAAEKRAEHAQKEYLDLERGTEALRAQNNQMRAWFRAGNLPCPADTPTVPKAPRDEFPHPIAVDWQVRGRMFLIRKVLADRLADVDAILSVAKSDHKTRAEVLGRQIKAIDDQLQAMFYEARAFRRIDVARGVAQVVCADDETWILDEKPLRSEATDATPAAGTDPPAEPADTKVLLAPGADAVSADSADAPAEAAPAPVLPPPPALSAPNVEAELVKLCNTLAPDEVIPLAAARERLATDVWRVEPNETFGKLVLQAARKAHKKDLIHHLAADGQEVVGRARKTGAVEQPPVVEQSPADRALEAIRAAGPAGLRRVEIMSTAHVDAATIDSLIQRGAIVPNGRRGMGARLIAKDLADSGSAASAGAGA